MSTISVPFSEMAEGLEEGCDERGGLVTKPYLVAWSDRLRFSQDVMGQSRQAGNSGGLWTRTVPYAYPESPGLYAVGTRITGVGRFYRTTPISFDNAIVTVTFRPLDWQAIPQDDPQYLNQIDPTTPILFATQELDFGAEWANVPNLKAQYLSDAAAVTSSNLSKRITVHRMAITWHKLPYLPVAQARSYADCVNDDTFLGCEAQTVFFEGPRTVREQMDDGTITQKLTYVFKWRQKSWNDFLRPEGTWDEVYYNGDSSVLTYPLKDFNALLFQAPAS